MHGAGAAKDAEKKQHNPLLSCELANQMEHVVMRILQMTLNKQWFDLVASGDKRFEYREYKPHWMSRLLGKEGIRNFDEIRFTNGYGKHRPFIRIGYEGAAIIAGEHCSPDNGEPLEAEQMYFVIGLGKVLEIGNA